MRTKKPTARGSAPASGALRRRTGSLAREGGTRRALSSRAGTTAPVATIVPRRSFATDLETRAVSYALASSMVTSGRSPHASLRTTFFRGEASPIVTSSRGCTRSRSACATPGDACPTARYATFILAWQKGSTIFQPVRSRRLLDAAARSEGRSVADHLLREVAMLEVAAPGLAIAAAPAMGATGDPGRPRSGRWSSTERSPSNRWAFRGSSTTTRPIAS